MPLSGDIKEHKYMYKDLCTRGGVWGVSADDVYKYDFDYNILVFSLELKHIRTPLRSYWARRASRCCIHRQSTAWTWC